VANLFYTSTFLVGDQKGATSRHRPPPLPGHHRQPRPNHRAPFLHDAELRGVSLKLTEPAVLHPVASSDQASSPDITAPTPLAADAFLVRYGVRGPPSCTSQTPLLTRRPPSHRR
jgi:hypothetical protein